MCRLTNSRTSIFWNVSNESTEWPGQAMTSTVSVKNLLGEDITFYYKTFANLSDDAAICFLFNYNGDADKTADINGITEDHYYLFKGNHEYEDITAQFKTVVDAEIGAVQLPGSYCSWTGDNAPMTLTDEKTYTITPDLSGVDDDLITFKLLVNSGSNWHWLGWNDVKVEAPEGWTQEAASDGNIQLNLTAAGTKQFTFTAIFGGGDNASANWTLKIAANNPSGISTLTRSQNASSPVYDLSGRKVAQAAKGLYIINGRKVIVK